MPRYWLILIFLLGTMNLMAQNPHGEGLKMDCKACHTADGWEIPMDRWKFNEDQEIKISQNTGWVIGWDTLQFNHQNTNFPFEGQHKGVDCRACHESLVFAPTSVECISCHTDVHQQTVGEDCARCHSAENWLVDNITQLHLENGFPLLGMHAEVACIDCHQSESGLQFFRIGNECINCHLDEFNATTNPNHISAGFSTECVDCHTIESFGWFSETVNHDFFPLTKGHEIDDCAACHINRNFSNTPTECIACHETAFIEAQNPNHQAADFSTDCIECHTTDIGWQPAEFQDHDNLFPVYSGAHQSTWEQCMDCHNNPNDYSQFTCTNCHTNPETDEQHAMVTGYTYENSACLACHPTGAADDVFDHNLTNFPLTGAHIEVECLACHGEGFVGTPTDCAACHQLDFEQTVNPNHKVLNLSTDCIECHTTEPDWMPAKFDMHDQFWSLNGAHATIADDCVACHNGDYNNTPTDCVGCHQQDFNQTTDPDHIASEFSTDCTQCHTENAWAPATFDHDQTNFPLRGAHATTDCIECHADGYEGTPTDCIACHQQDFDTTTDPNHKSNNFSTDCLQCHTENAWEPSTFDHDQTEFPLTGAHVGVDCIDCHSAGYVNTPTDCAACHQLNFDQSINPNHKVLNLSTDCIECHTTEPDWMPAKFDIHDQFWPLNGAHAAVAMDCAACHSGDYTNTPTDCIGCHQQDFDNTTDPNHKVLGFPTDCTICHTETAWEPATFDHDQTNFPLRGAHATTDCIECHADGYEGTPTDCVACHQQDFNQTTDPDHQASGFSTDCIVCHTETAWVPATFDHDQTSFPLRGEHRDVDCIECHTDGYEGTPTDCFACHQADFDQTDDPNHRAAGFPTECTICHTESGWELVIFDHNQTNFPLRGAHATTDCIECHVDGYVGTPTDCVACHQSDFNQTTNPDHQASGFSTDCKACHTEETWIPATFDHDETNFPLRGAHATTDCIECHADGYAGTPTECIACHQSDFNNARNPNHQRAGFPTDCTQCHSEIAWEPSSFDHDAMYFPIYSGNHQNEWTLCSECHLNNDFSAFSCIDCHEHNDPNELRDDHDGVNGYRFVSSACYECHPNGEE